MKFNKLAWCFGLLFAVSTCFAQMYTVDDLRTLSAAGYSKATGINASGQVIGQSVSKPPLGYLKMVGGTVGCSDIFGVALDRLGQPYVTGTTWGCDNFSVFIGGPHYGVFFNFWPFVGSFTMESGFGIAVDAAGNAYVTGTSYGIINPVNAMQGCTIDLGNIVDA
jgi:Beta-propeller repeat